MGPYIVQFEEMGKCEIREMAIAVILVLVMNVDKGLILLSVTDRR